MSPERDSGLVLKNKQTKNKTKQTNKKQNKNKVTLE